MNLDSDSMIENIEMRSRDLGSSLKFNIRIRDPVLIVTDFSFEINPICDSTILTIRKILDISN